MSWSFRLFPPFSCLIPRATLPAPCKTVMSITADSRRRRDGGAAPNDVAILLRGLAVSTLEAVDDTDNERRGRAPGRDAGTTPAGCCRPLPVGDSMTELGRVSVETASHSASRGDEVLPVSILRSEPLPTLGRPWLSMGRCCISGEALAEAIIDGEAARTPKRRSSLGDAAGKPTSSPLESRLPQPISPGPGGGTETANGSPGEPVNWLCWRLLRGDCDPGDMRPGE